jgi:hypothetical protein
MLIVVLFEYLYNCSGSIISFTSPTIIVAIVVSSSLLPNFTDLMTWTWATLHKKFTGDGDDGGSKRLCVKGGGRNDKLMGHWIMIRGLSNQGMEISAKWSALNGDRGRRERGAVAATTKNGGSRRWLKRWWRRGRQDGRLKWGWDRINLDGLNHASRKIDEAEGR